LAKESAKGQLQRKEELGGEELDRAA